jgi:hypothetical protein
MNAKGQTHDHSSGQVFKAGVILLRKLCGMAALE